MKIRLGYLPGPVVRDFKIALPSTPMTTTKDMPPLRQMDYHLAWRRAACPTLDFQVKPIIFKSLAQITAWLAKQSKFALNHEVYLLSDKDLASWQKSGLRLENYLKREEARIHRPPPKVYN